MPQNSFGISPGAGFLSDSLAEANTSVGNISGSLNTLNLPNSDLDMSTISQKSDVCASYDIKKFTSRLSSHMSTLSDGLPFSDIDDIEEMDSINEAGELNCSERGQGAKSFLQKIREKHAELDDGSLFSSQPVTRSTTPKPARSAVFNVASNLQEITPTKPNQPEVDPLTPTANLKLLSSAASPEIRNREKQKLLLNDTGEFDMTELSFNANCFEVEDYLGSKEDVLITGSSGEKRAQRSRKKPKKLKDVEATRASQDDEEATSAPYISRKEKSLGLLCQRFLALYPENPGVCGAYHICLDKVAAELCVERRRIYDIVNVLESVNMLSKIAKNKYAWHGKTNIINTLYNLKITALKSDLQEQLESIKRKTKQKESEQSPGKKRTPLRFSDRPNTNVSALHENKEQRKDKSLGILSQRFLSLFLVCKEPRIISLEESAKILIGDSFSIKNETGKYKTKIRRLYDIANILTSLDLIEKMHVPDTKGRKPAFQYIGPDPSTLHPVAEMPPVAVNIPQANYFDGGTTNRIFVVQPNKPVKSKKVLQRHPSFEQICQVAESEREKLYFQSSNAENSAELVSSKMEQQPQSICIVKNPKAATAPATTTQNTSVVTLSKDELNLLIDKLHNSNSDSVEVNNDSGEKAQMKISGALLNALKQARDSTNKSSQASSGSGNAADVVKQVRIVRRSRPVAVCQVPLKRDSKAPTTFVPKIPKTEPMEKSDNSQKAEKPNSIPGLSPLRPLSLGDPYPYMPRIPSMDVGLASPLPVSQGNSGLNTPTLPEGVLEEKSKQGENNRDVFQFPPPPIKIEPQSRSLPSTPTLQLSNTSSPVMFLSNKSAISDGSDPNLVPAANNLTVNQANNAILTPQCGTNSVFLTPQSGSSPLVLGTGFLTPQNALNSGLITPQSGTFMLCSPTMSPLAPFTSTPTASFLLPNGMLCTPTDQTENLFKATPTEVQKVFSITPLNARPTSGIAPSSDKIVNLMSLFSTSPDIPSGNDTGLASPTTNILAESASTTVENSDVLPNCEISEGTTASTPQCSGNSRGEINAAFTPVVSKVKQVATPGTFFRGTPEASNFASSMNGNRLSAFQNTNSVKLPSAVPARKLNLINNSSSK